MYTSSSIAVRDILCFNLTFSLARVVLASNFIEAIPIPNDDSDFLPGLKYLSLSDNRMSEWGAIDALARWCPSLESMVIKGNPLVAGKESPSLVHCCPFHQEY